MPAWKTSGGRESTDPVSKTVQDSHDCDVPTFFSLLRLEIGNLVVRPKGLEVVPAIEVVETGDELVGELDGGCSIGVC